MSKIMYGIIYKVENGFIKKSCNIWVFHSIEEREREIASDPERYKNDMLVQMIIN